MIYTDLCSLCEAVAKCDMDDTNSVAKYRQLIAVYFEALNNPPQFVIGVGAISYAQEMLVSAQIDIKE
tara:strand:+ start:599 stop:802 length:204 start_codon:yes stop_codon:yes gene_type:complete